MRYRLFFAAAALAAVSTAGCYKRSEPVSIAPNLNDTFVGDPSYNDTFPDTPFVNDTFVDPAFEADEPPPVEEEPAADLPQTEPSEDAPAEDPAAEAPAEDASAEAKPAGGGDPLAAVDPSANAPVEPGDWPQWGGTSYRNNVPIAENIPTEWDIGGFDRKTGEWQSEDAQNIKWVANLGSQSYGNPVVAGGKVFVGTNNSHGYLPRYPGDVDLGCLIAFDEENGEFLWQHSSEKLPTGRVHDWPLQGICSAPLVEGDRAWFTSSRGHVVCVDVEGFYDGEDDGPVQNELARQFDIESPDAAADALAEGKLNDEFTASLERTENAIEGEPQVKTEEEGRRWSIVATVDGKERQLIARREGPRLAVYKITTPDDKHEADVIWSFDMMKQLGVSQHNMASCSPTSHGDLLFINTSNGLDETHINLPAPDAPSFICMDKNTGEVYWTDKSPGQNILHGQWSSPTVGVLGGAPQALFAGGDGWLYSFKADKGQDGKPELLWKFDCNPKMSVWKIGGAGTRNNIIATPVIYDGLVYVAVGQDPEHGEGEGHLWCIDPNKRGDVSPQLAVKIEGGERKPIPHRRLQAVIEEDGEAAVDNPNSAVIWHYSKFDYNADDEIDWEEEMHRSCGTVAIKDDVLYISDFSGLLHCLDAKTGKGHWTYDMLAASWGSPLIVDGHVYVGDEDGDVCIFEHSKEPQEEPLVEINMGNSVYSTPIVANGVLYIANRTHLFAIQEQSKSAE
ncbi:MAG: PQQ-binding-like beta-propeller repeat protein [Planctomycetes bacterium]|nr:PQQ-binding-like beta-propeller repeat protein [Planctomycetota bacterium]